MNKFGLVLIALLGGTTLVPAQDRPRLFGKQKNCAPTPYAPIDCPPGIPGTPGADPNRSPLDPANPLSPNAAQNPSNSAFQEALASAGEGGTQPGASFMPGFFGDLLASSIVQGGFSFGSITAPNVSQAGAIKLAEGDSPRPFNRVYYNYNHFGNIEVALFGNGAPEMAVDRHVIGVEKTLLDGNASVGLRLPFFTIGGDSIEYNTGFVGDLTIITKYALVNNRCNGNLISTGLAITVPSGGEPVYQTPNGRIRQQRYRSVTLQPFVGYIFNPRPRLFFQGFHSVAVPTDSRDVTFMSNGVSGGFWLYRNLDDGFIQGIVPTMEVHVNTPFNHRVQTGAAGDTFMADSVNLTMGGHIVLPRSVLGGAVGVPLAYGPHRIEALATYTLRY